MRMLVTLEMENEQEIGFSLRQWCLINPIQRQLFQIAIGLRVQRHTGLTDHIYFLTFGRSGAQD